MNGIYRTPDNKGDNLLSPKEALSTGIVVHLLESLDKGFP